MHSCYHPRPPHPPKPLPPQGYLVQKIVACEKRSMPCLCTEWCFDCGGSGCIQRVAAAGAPCWTIENGCTLRISIPVNVYLSDACGRCCTHPAAVTVETNLPHAFLCGLEDVRHTLLILPCVRLIGAESTCGGCFQVKLAVALDLFLLCYETLFCGAPKPSCPQLPLYPPPLC